MFGGRAMPNHNEHILFRKRFRAVLPFLICFFLQCQAKAEVRSLEPEHIIQHREMCAENSEDIFESLFFERSKEMVQTRAGQVTSVVATTGTAVTETIVYLGGGAVVGILVCSPILLLEASSKSKSSEGASCVLEVGSKVAAGLATEGGYEYTQKVWKDTADLREFDFDELSQLVRENCECYMKTGTQKDLETAFRQIGEWKKEHGIYPHLTKEEKEKVEILEKTIYNRLNHTKADF